MALGSPHPLTYLPGGLKCGRRVKLTSPPSVSRLPTKSWILDSSGLYRPPGPVTALPLRLLSHYMLLAPSECNLLMQISVGPHCIMCFSRQLCPWWNLINCQSLSVRASVFNGTCIGLINCYIRLPIICFTGNVGAFVYDVSIVLVWILIISL
jgi:hypothetical protein